MQHGFIADEEQGGPHQHSLSRLRKADKWAQQLKRLCEELGDRRTSLEADAYALWMHATLMIEGEEWKAAVEHFVKSQAIYEELAKVHASYHQISLTVHSISMMLLRYAVANLERDYTALTNCFGKSSVLLMYVHGRWVRLQIRS